MTPLLVVLILAAVACVFAWVASLVSSDTSWVDRCWSIVPVLYTWIFAVSARLSDARLDVLATLVTMWGVRLTYNFARKGGYAGVEDYRWAVLRETMTPRQFQVFNVFFIVFYQNLILVLITLPAYSAYEHRSGATYGLLDGVLALTFVLCLIGETLADQQQWNFQRQKQRDRDAGRSIESQFLTTGLFRNSRHPNYFFELAQWWLVFFMGALAAGSLAQWSVLGVVLLTLLFVGSTRFTEKITLARYPEYATYQRRTSPVIPWRRRSENARA